MQSKWVWVTAVASMWAGAAAAKPAVEAADASKGPTSEMKKVLEAMQTFHPKPLHTVTPEQARQGPTPKDAVLKVLKDSGKEATPEKVAKVTDREIPGPAGKVSVRVYAPEGAGPFPLVVYYHGGGFVIATLDVYDSTPRALANQAKAVVVSVEYRKAPEHPFPAALDDATAAFQYVQAHQQEFGGDGQHLAVAGESAGANLATAVAMAQKQSKQPMPDFQVLAYPFVSNDLSTPSHQRNGKGNYLIGNEDIAWFWKNDLGANWKENRDPKALPIYATKAQLQGLPPALVVTAGLDPLQDEGQAFAQKLKEAGVQVDARNYDGVTHEFFSMGAVLPEAMQANAAAGEALKKAWSTKKGVGGSGPSK